MIDKNKISEMISLRNFHATCGGDAQDEWWTEVPDMLSKNIEETKEFFNTCRKEDLEVLTELFEGISKRLKSQEFIKFIEELQVKHPDIDMKQDIEWAKYAIED